MATGEYFPEFRDQGTRTQGPRSALTSHPSPRCNPSEMWLWLWVKTGVLKVRSRKEQSSNAFQTEDLARETKHSK